MMGSLASMTGYYVVLFALVIWMVVRIARSSGLMALLVFLFWPASLIALVRYWGDRESDIRLPFVLAVLSAGLAMHMAVRVVDQGYLELAAHMSPDDIELIRQSDPELAAQIEAAREQLLAEYDDEDDDYDHDHDHDQPARRSTGPRVPAPARADHADEPPVAVVLDPAERERLRQGELRQATASLAYRFGTVGFDQAGAKLAMPNGFRFAPRQALTRLSKLRGYPVTSDTLGWLVNRDVDLTSDDGWFVEVRFIRLEAANLASELARAVDPTGRARLGQGAFAARWHQEHAVATWAMLPSDEPRSDLYAARALRDGVLLFAVRGLAPGEEELGLRATRLMALRSQPERPPRLEDTPAALAAWIAAAGAEVVSSPSSSEVR
jgi:hypothetical protein